MFKFSDLLIPVIQAPMAGGINTPQLAAAVANAGGLGSFGFAYSSPEKIDADLKATTALLNAAHSKRVNANFFVFQEPKMPSIDVQNQALADLRTVLSKRPISVEIPKPPYIPNLKDMLEPIWIHRPDVLTFHFGLPEQEFIERAKELGIQVGITATCIDEALKIQATGADFIVVQGIEAGGHRGIFHPDQADEKLSVSELLKQLQAHVSIPMVAAGGIMNGRDIQGVLALGAVAAQMGTAFLVASESGASPAHRRYVLNEHGRGAQFTQAFSGRPAQGILNQYMMEMKNKTYLPFPIQNLLTASMRKWAGEQDDGEYQNLWAGTAYAKARAMSAQDLMKTLQAELISLKNHP